MKKNYFLSLDKSLSIAILISTMFHITVFFPFWQFKPLARKKAVPDLKITYLLPKETFFKKAALKEKNPLIARKQMREQDVQPKTPPADKVKTEQKLIKKVINVPRPLEKRPESQYAKIEIPKEVPEKEQKAYLSYYQSIRESIRKFVERNYPRYIACGEVCLYFVLSSDGRLKENDIIQRRSTQNRQLKEIAKRSLQEAAPFTPFPGGLTARELSFNILISFELEN